MRDVLHFVICGSVDDGNSTLIGRLLLESKEVYGDDLAALAKDSTRYGEQGGALDLALMVDGLEAECEQSITVNVAHRFFSTPQRCFVVADARGHEQYTRNLATGASYSDLAVLVVNASKGLQPQTHRHARIVALLGIRHLVMAVNKMDLVQWDETVFRQIAEQFEPLVSALGFESFRAIPVSALHGDNVAATSSAASWYMGPNLLAWLESIEVSRSGQELNFRMPVQWVNRHSEDSDGYCGRVVSGEVKVGDRICIMPSGMESKVRSIIALKESRQTAVGGESITICLDDEIDVCRGSVISAADDPLEVSDQFEAKILCLSENRLLAHRSYVFNLHTCQAVATINAIKYRIDVTLGTHLATRSLGLNDIGVVNLSLDRPVPFEPYQRCRSLSCFVLADRLDNQTVGAGMINFALRRAANLHWQTSAINKEARAGQKFQKPVCLWLTGLSGAGKSTIANLLEKRLFATGRHTYILDGDNIRLGLNRDLGFSEADRIENIRRVTEVARLLVDAGLVVLVAFISPYRAEREAARSRFDPGEFLEIFVDAPLEECERRDPKGLYAKARRGELVNFTGIDSKYEPPQIPEIHLDTVAYNPEECVDQVLHVLNESASGVAAGS
jgi:bifunctional enzyme CysN/CysC